MMRYCVHFNTNNHALRKKDGVVRQFGYVFLGSLVLTASRPLARCPGLAEEGGDGGGGEAVVSLILTFSLITV